MLVEVTFGPHALDPISEPIEPFRLGEGLDGGEALDRSDRDSPEEVENDSEPEACGYGECAGRHRETARVGG